MCLQLRDLCERNKLKLYHFYFNQIQNTNNNSSKEPIYIYTYILYIIAKSTFIQIKNIGICSKNIRIVLVFKLINILDKLNNNQVISYLFRLNLEFQRNIT